MASDMATRRLRKELMAIKRTPIDNIVVRYAGYCWYCKQLLLVVLKVTLIGHSPTPSNQKHAFFSVQ